MADSLTNISSSYNMVEILRDIGSNYFGPELSEQRIGMFGYTTEALANIFGATILDASHRQQEYNVYTAKKRSTLLYEGVKLNEYIDNAKPGKMTAYIGILTKDIAPNLPSLPHYSTINNDTSIDNNTPNYDLVI